MGKAKDEGTNEQQIIFDFLKQQNRPYSAQLLITSLGSKVKKTATQKALDSLTEKGKLTEKLFGKTKIYWLNQDNIEAVDASGLVKLDEEIKELNEKLKEVQSEVASKEAVWKSLSSSLTTEEAEKRIKELEAENANLKATAERLKESAQHITKEQMLQTEKDCKNAQNTWRKRRRICLDIVDAIGEQSNKKFSHFKEELGLEGDEDHGVSINDSRAEKRKREVDAFRAASKNTNKKKAT